jgi:phosphohistidine swiveling domain-containing protein
MYEGLFMLTFVKPHSTLKFAENEAGGKGFSLFLLTQKGFPVPQWFVLSKRFFTQFLESQGLHLKIQALLQQTDFSSPQQTESTSKVISQWISATEFSPQFLSLLNSELAKLNTLEVSVRSSAADEDGDKHSFAGLLSSVLYLSTAEDKREKILEAIKTCWSSAFSARSLSYRYENKIPFHTISVALVIQEMIDPEASGVMFTCDPLTQKLHSYTISGVWGVGEGLVSGALECDTFWYDIQQGHITERSIVEKKTQFKRDHSLDTGCREVSVPESQHVKPVLSDQQVTELAQLGAALDDFYHGPQDIEWALKDGKLYILQSRPVTTLKRLQGHTNLWDNSNIVESYGGHTKPLSFTFALRNYKNVYVQFCEILGIDSVTVKDMDSYLSNMLGYLGGRVYYNLFNWYKLVGILPGVKFNRSSMELMMGVSEELSAVELEKRLEVHPSWQGSKGKGKRLRTGLAFFYYHLTIQFQVKKFLSEFNRSYNYFRGLPFNQMRGDELLLAYQEIEQKMLSKWKAPIVNDFLCMVHFGLLRKLTLKWFPEHPDQQNDLLAAEGGLESAEPTKELIKLAYIARSHRELEELLKKVPAADLLEALAQQDGQVQKQFYQQVLSYLDRFGFRCMSEMKLEEIDLHTDPSYLFVCLKNYLSLPQLPEDHSARDLERRKKAERRISELSLPKSLLYRWSLKHARRAVKNRENTRFARTRIYGIARTLFRQIGKHFERQDILVHREDIFWLEIEEIFAIYHGTLTTTSLKELVALRKAEAEHYLAEPLPRLLTRSEVYWGHDFYTSEKPAEVYTDCDLKGLACSPGVVEGIVKVIENPQDDLTLSGEILVTKRTDPGWVPLYPSLSGILVERGSLLSHSAIVAREMGLPAIVSIPGLTEKIKSGMRVRFDGKTGQIHIL